MPVMYHATALVKCQFRGSIYPPGRVYSGFVKPPDGLFRIDREESMTTEAANAQKEKDKAPPLTPSDPTPRERPDDKPEPGSKPNKP